MSPTKEEEPRHSNESEDDVNIENNLLKKGKSIKSFRTTSPTKCRKKSNNKSTPIKSVSKNTPSKLKQKEVANSHSSKKGNAKQRLIKSEVIDDNKTETLASPLLKPVQIETVTSLDEATEKKVIKLETAENETDQPDWDVRVSPGHSVESMDTCEESSQDSLPVQGSESDDSIILQEVESDNSEDSNEEMSTEHENSQTWNRDEDKVILQTFQKNGDSQNVFKEIQHLLPGRSVPEIRQRFHILMGLLQEMSSSK